MNKRFPTRKQTFAILSPAVVMSVLLQVLPGWDPKLFCLSLLINILVVGIVLRYRTPVSGTPSQNPRSGIDSFIMRVAFWVFVAVILFFVSKRFQ